MLGVRVCCETFFENSDNASNGMADQPNSRCIERKGQQDREKSEHPTAKHHPFALPSRPSGHGDRQSGDQKEQKPVIGFLVSGIFFPHSELKMPNSKQCIPRAAASKRGFAWGVGRRPAGYIAVELSR